MHGESTPPPGQRDDDADLADLLVFFMDELKVRADALVNAWKLGEMESLQSLAHEMQEAGYGYPGITEQAATLEASLLAEEAELSSIGEQVESLINLCRRTDRDDDPIE